ncbi:hypothetical protein Drose_28125 [Dactylosporangium roseum]|uniref:Uncharacterized protein n=1 Tax=Dactylosporangium roseum TaxID=47989 RepID=A0ABY5Z1S8_9ACTN|nr:hypothetical protein [Dactylosporangium roseum]UWZ35010.1 hypothetical protein Drose_28125 [Dactylosporangium roseum]
MTVGRHSLGRPGLERRELIAVTVDQDGRRPVRHARHRRVRSMWQWTGEAMGIVVAAAVLGVLAVSGWYTASGATAVAQMLAR